MLFNTIQYAFFLIIVVAAFYALRKSRGARLWLLLAASYFFYASWNIFFLPLILGLSQFNYFLGLWSGKAKKLDNV